MEQHFRSKQPVSLLMAIADHPWTKATRDAAAVRIAMAVVCKGQLEGVLYGVRKEQGLDTDDPRIELSEKRGTINSDLTIGTDVTRAVALEANAYVCSPGVKLHGDGFIVTRAEAGSLGLGKRLGLERHIRRYRNGRDVTTIPREVMVIDLFGLGADEVRRRFPEVYQHVLLTVKESRDDKGRPNGRDVNNRESYRDNWWIFGEARADFRPALEHIQTYIATPVTQKHRFFVKMEKAILPDDALMCMAMSDACYLGVLSSRIFLIWFNANNSTLEDRPRFIKSKCFDPFPFPAASEPQKSAIRAVAEELDALRKQVQADHPGLTLTQIYNVLEKLRAGQKLDAEDEEIKKKGLVLIVRELHDKIDALVAEAYGWPVDLPDEEILSRLVALNAERAAEEKRGLVRWLRPDYQMRRAGITPDAPEREPEEQLEAPLVAPAAKAQKPAFPSGELERTVAVFAALMQAKAPTDAESLAREFRQGAKVEAAIARILAAMARIGHAHSPDGKRYALPPAA